MRRPHKVSGKWSVKEERPGAYGVLEAKLRAVRKRGARSCPPTGNVVVVGDLDQSRLGQNAHRSPIGEASRENEEEGKKLK